jgi:hypothetical protein
MNTDPQGTALPIPVGASPGAATRPVYNGGLVQAAPLQTLIEEERAKTVETQTQPLITGLVGHIRKCWSQARDAKENTILPRMLCSMRARRGEYDPDKLAAIRAMGGSEIYMNMTSVKCRAAASWLRDVLAATGTGERPWTVRPTPVPELPAQLNDRIVAAVGQHLAAAQQSGVIVNDEQLLQALADTREEARHAVMEEARRRADLMADKMEDQLVQGGFIDALDQFIEDIVTFPAAILKGPVIRKRKVMKWKQVGTEFEPDVEESLKLEWERVSPFNIYPSPAAVKIDDGYLIEKHQLSREDLNALIGVEGYDDNAIRDVLRDYGSGGLRDWTTNDVAIADAEGKSAQQIGQNDDALIDALQFWGPVSGKMLREWGMSEDEILDETKEYHVEAWLVGTYCIKAVLNYDPLCRRPYYKASYEEIPGSFWGNAITDLITDTQTIVNATARAIVNNMGIASGPQVHVNIDRLASGEDVTQLSPWRIWQTTSNPVGTNEAPINFFQPDSRIGELMAVFEKFSMLSDEYSGLPKYMAGDNAGGAGRTASGLSMLMGNAGKAIKQVVANIDIGVLTPLLVQLYDHNMRYAEDADLKGDVEIVARGAASLVNKETAQVRRNEFLATTANPIDVQIMGIEGRAAVLREAAKNLDMDVDKIVPALTPLRTRMAAAAMAAQGGAPGQQALPSPPSGSGQTLSDGSPTTDNYTPQGQ